MSDTANHYYPRAAAAQSQADRDLTRSALERHVEARKAEEARRQREELEAEEARQAAARKLGSMARGEHHEEARKAAEEEQRRQAAAREQERWERIQQGLIIQMRQARHR